MFEGLIKKLLKIINNNLLFPNSFSIRNVSDTIFLFHSLKHISLSSRSFVYLEIFSKLLVIFLKVIPFVSFLPWVFFFCMSWFGSRSLDKRRQCTVAGVVRKVSLGENCCELQEIKKFLQYQPTSQSQSVVSQHPLDSEVRPE